jgi:nucleoside-diphosphate-sugar epimerase
MAYLVTGGTGFIGSYVVRDLLNAGKEVVCLQRSGVTPTFREVVSEDNIHKVKVIQGDVSNTLQLFDLIRENDIDLIIHLGYLQNGPGDLQPAYALRVNCIGTNNVLEAARLFGLKRVIWSSSGKAIGRLGEFYQEPIGDDNAIYMPDTMYGATKAVNEVMAKLYFEKFGVDVIGFRLGRTYGGVGKWLGPGGLFARFIRKAALNIPVTIAKGDADPVRGNGYAYIEDISNLIVKACEAPTTKTRVFNAIEGIYTNRQVIETIRNINPQARVTIGESVESEVFKNTRPALLDATKVRIELGWKPKYSLEEGLRKFFNYFRQQEGMPLL